MKTYTEFRATITTTLKQRLNITQRMSRLHHLTNFWMKLSLISRLKILVNICVLLVSVYFCVVLILYSGIGPYNPAPFGGPSEPGIEHFNAGAHGHRGLGSVPSGLFPRQFPPELGQPTAHDQSLQCEYSNVCKFIPTDLFL